MPSAGEGSSHTAEHRLAERALLASELCYRGLFEAGMDRVLILDARTGEVADANPFATDFLGYTLPELIGLKLWDVGSFKDIAASETAFAELQAPKTFATKTRRCKPKGGRQREVEFISNCYLEA